MQFNVARNSEKRAFICSVGWMVGVGFLYFCLSSICFSEDFVYAFLRKYFSFPEFSLENRFSLRVCVARRVLSIYSSFPSESSLLAEGGRIARNKFFSPEK